MEPQHNYFRSFFQYVVIWLSALTSITCLHLIATVGLQLLLFIVLYKGVKTFNSVDRPGRGREGIPYKKDGNARLKF